MAPEAEKSTMKDPRPHLRAAAGAARNLILLQRDLAMITAQVRARQQARRLALAISAVLLGHLALFFGLFWFAQAAYDAGLDPRLLALTLFISLALPAVVCARLALKKEEPSHEKRKRAADSN